MSKYRGVYPTDSGMHCLWDASAFAGVTDYPSWERELLDDADIVRHIRAGDLVPLNIQSDGAVEVEVRIEEPGALLELTERELKYLVVRSDPYLLRSRGLVHVSGIEYVSSPPEEVVGTIPLPAGDYSATAHLLAWDEEPGMRDDKGNPAAGALPDYLVLVSPVRAQQQFRTELQTFARSK